ncbi:hypothetical protein LOK49_LG01G01982 [Camellia lanceoleosa]|uniref:Uncharacterized protein n=1 Tax=Camellia lanceoleosa TaxID=1840588 RepID=A0ACC0IZB5_9ERIC|nr:hypothetical protein LOK49_LG01G01982 [Camellia lanceoleosa]
MFSRSLSFHTCFNPLFRSTPALSVSFTFPRFLQLPSIASCLLRRRPPPKALLTRSSLIIKIIVTATRITIVCQICCVRCCFITSYFIAIAQVIFDFHSTVQ